MSTESVDPSLVEKAKEEIRAIVGEINELAKQDLGLAEFYAAFLQRVVGALGGVGGAVWTPAANNLELSYQINLRDTGLADQDEALQRHGQTIRQVLRSGEGMLVPPHSGFDDQAQAGNPTPYLLVLAPVKVDAEVRGVIEVFQRASARPATQRGYLSFLIKMCDVASEYLTTQQLRLFSDRQALWNQLEQFTRAVHASLHPIETAFTIANEGRRLVQCDRVSVALRRGRKYRVEAISGQDTFDRRSTSVQLLNRLATAVAATGDPMWYSGDTQDFAPQVEEAVQAYVDDAHSKTVIVLPLARGGPQTEGEWIARETIGVLLIEQIENSRLREGTQQRVQVVADHSAEALANALEYHNLFLLPVWRDLGRARWVLKARTLPKTLAVAAAVVGLVAGLVFVPWDFKLSGDGKLQPVDRREVFAATDGTVEKVLVRHRERVVAGQPLAELRNTELAVQIKDTDGKLSTAQVSLSSIESQRRRNRSPSTSNTAQQSIVDEIELAGQQARLEQEVKSLREQRRLLETKREQLVVRSPMNGLITTNWDALRALDQRTIQAGAAVMSVADPDGEWEIEVEMPEDRMGHVTRALREVEAQSSGARLPVSFILATDPGTEHEGEVREVHLAAEVRGEQGNTVLVRVDFDRTGVDEQLLRPGATTRAKLHCGRRSIGYVLLHDAIAWVQSNIWFRFF